MSIILAPSSLFPVDEAENSDCEQCEKFDKQLVELRSMKSGPPADAVTTPGTSTSNEAASEPAFAAAAASKSATSSKVSCVPDIVIDCTCLDPRPKPTQLYYCCCLNVRCSVSACRALLFVLAFGLLGGAVLAAAVVAVWGLATDWTEARNYGLLALLISLLLFIYVCCVASHCQAGRKTRELRELAAQQQQQQLQQQQQTATDRRIQPNRLSNNCLASSQLSLQYLQEDALQQQQQSQQKKKARPKATGAAKGKKSTPTATAAGKKSVRGGGEERVLLPTQLSGSVSLGMDKF
ncbi:hypothetical protein BOX15_Mlig029283g2 [Macrostomum lignano]|uniref:Uncharacterized protein n=1 Tax=Macrostomum lignano TaxID=282301 RepID=A0A267DZ23_9PLAT|nr:hypothetical protein BOX15_Mlig029283g2 [Macrostomum lignano]